MNDELNSTLFGTAGTPNAFYASGYKHSTEMPEYLSSIGIDAFEYQCGRGVTIKRETAEKIAAKAQKYSIYMSIHSPYYISLSTDDEVKAKNNVRYVLESAMAVNYLGGNRVVVHSGSCGNTSREIALELSKKNLLYARQTLVDNGLSHIHICPETMGKINQLGTLEEVLELCQLDESFIPCIDFGHLNARTHGSIKTAEDYERILNITLNAIGEARTKIFHAHFSKIEYSAGGEVRHLTFENSVFGPDFVLLADVLARRGYTPIIICESEGTQDVDAAYMKQTFASCGGKITKNIF